jgi:hypothetical protein
MNRLLLIFAAAGIIAASGCAMMSHGSRESIQVDSDPPGPKFTVDADTVPYTTPATIELTRGQDHTLAFHRNAYDDYKVNLTHSTSGAVLGNVLLGGLVGVGTDYVSGAAYQLNNANLKDEVLKVTMISSVPPAAAGGGNPTAAIGTTNLSVAEAGASVDTAAHNSQSEVAPAVSSSVSGGLLPAQSASSGASRGTAAVAGGSK